MDRGETWRIVVDEVCPAAAQMQRDAQLAQEAHPVLRLFCWDPPAVSWGWRQRLPSWVLARQSHSEDVEFVERPTGGGIAFHGSDVSLAVVIPRAWGLALSTLMSAVCERAAGLCRAWGLKARAVLEVETRHTPVTYCLTETSPYALLCEERKIAGFAARRYPQSWLIQGSLLVRPLPAPLQGILPPEVREQVRRRAAPVSELAGCAIEPSAVAARWAMDWPAWWDELTCDRMAVAR